VSVRAVLFDAGNTLLRMNYGAIAAHLATHDVAPGVDAIQRAEWRARVRLDADVFARPAPGMSTESGSTSERYLRYILDELGVTDAATVASVIAWRRGYNPPAGIFNTAEPEAATALALVHEAGLRAAVISNSNGSVRAVLDGLGLTRHVDYVIDSGEVGVEKPDPRIFRLALERSGVDAAAAVYIGDLYSVDVLGARAVGIRTILLDPGGHWGERDCETAPTVLEAVRLVLRAPRG
jgi:putative hydrolase of the HAD superfamily